jgi:hypothetical protein
MRTQGGQVMTAMMTNHEETIYLFNTQPLILVFSVVIPPCITECLHPIILISLSPYDPRALCSEAIGSSFPLLAPLLHRIIGRADTR